MIYTVWAITDGTTYPLLTETTAVNDPVITEYAGNTPDAFSFSIPMDHVAYAHVQEFKTRVYVQLGTEKVYQGRITAIDEDFFKTKAVTCEGVLGYLYDSIDRPRRFNGNLTGYITSLLTNHNSQVEAWKQIQLGTINLDSIGAETFVVENTGYTPTMEALSDLVKKYGGYLRIRSEGDTNYLDYLSVIGTNDQVIRYAVNIVDLQQKRNINDFFTALIPTGGDVAVQIPPGEEEPHNGQSSKETVTIKSVNNNVDYIFNQDAVDAYGWIFRQESWPDITDPAELLDKAQERLAKILYMGATLSLGAVDLADMGVDANRLKTGCDTVVVSTIHNINAHYIIEQRTKHLLDPGQDTFEMGDIEKPMSEYSVSNKASAAHDVKNLNASDIKGGDLVLGGASCNKFGSIIIKSPEDDEIGRWNERGFYVGQGVINLTRNGNTGLYINGAEYKFGDFEINDAYGRQILQSSDERSGISGEPNTAGGLYLWAGYRSNNDYVFVVNTDGDGGGNVFIMYNPPGAGSRQTYNIGQEIYNMKHAISDLDDRVTDLENAEPVNAGPGNA